MRFLWGMAICVVCRATKLRPHAREIAHDQQKCAADITACEALTDTRDSQRVADMAIDSVHGSHVALEETPQNGS